MHTQTTTSRDVKIFNHESGQWRDPTPAERAEIRQRVTPSAAKTEPTFSEMLVDAEAKIKSLGGTWRRRTSNRCLSVELSEANGVLASLTAAKLPSAKLAAVPRTMEPVLSRKENLWRQYHTLSDPREQRKFWQLHLAN